MYAAHQAHSVVTASGHPRLVKAQKQVRCLRS